MKTKRFFDDPGANNVTDGSVEYYECNWDAPIDHSDKPEYHGHCHAHCYHDMPCSCPCSCEDDVETPIDDLGEEGWYPCHDAEHAHLNLIPTHVCCCHYYRVAQETPPEEPTPPPPQDGCDDFCPCCPQPEPEIPTGDCDDFCPCYPQPEPQPEPESPVDPPQPEFDVPMYTFYCKCYPVPADCLPPECVPPDAEVIPPVDPEDPTDPIGDGCGCHHHHHHHHHCHHHCVPQEDTAPVVEPLAPVDLEPVTPCDIAPTPLVAPASSRSEMQLRRARNEEKRARAARFLCSQCSEKIARETLLNSTVSSDDCGCMCTAETPFVETPAFEVPAAKMPIIEAPVVKTPVFEAPVCTAPVVETPVVEAPIIETPACAAPIQIQTPTPVQQTYYYGKGYTGANTTTSIPRPMSPSAVGVRTTYAFTREKLYQSDEEKGGFFIPSNAPR